LTLSYLLKEEVGKFKNSYGDNFDYLIYFKVI